MLDYFSAHRLTPLNCLPPCFTCLGHQLGPKHLEHTLWMNSKKGAFYYKLDKKHYKKNFHKVLNIIPNLNDLL